MAPYKQPSLVCTFFELVCEEGGFLGSLVTRLLVPAIGVIGTYVVVIVSMIICLIIVTGKSALKGVKKHGGKAYSKAREDGRRKQETSRIRKPALRRPPLIFLLLLRQPLPP